MKGIEKVINESNLGLEQLNFSQIAYILEVHQKWESCLEEKDKNLEAQSLYVYESM